MCVFEIVRQRDDYMRRWPHRRRRRRQRARSARGRVVCARLVRERRTVVGDRLQRRIHAVHLRTGRARTRTAAKGLGASQLAAPRAAGLTRGAERRRLRRPTCAASSFAMVATVVRCGSAAVSSGRDSAGSADRSKSSGGSWRSAAPSRPAQSGAPPVWWTALKFFQRTPSRWAVSCAQPPECCAARYCPSGSQLLY
eukprot:SAG11_NODE_750_length_7360_cov_7.329522_7_plen_197_part_00